MKSVRFSNFARSKGFFKNDVVKSSALLNKITKIKVHKTNPSFRNSR